MNWAVGITVPEETAEREWVISQASSVLEEDCQRPGRWALMSALGAVEVRNGSGDHSYTFPEEPFRIFKLFGRSRDRGTYMQSLTCGRFLVVAPADWELKTESPGIESPIAPEYLVGMQWRAHHVKLSQRAAGPLPMLVAQEGTRQQIPMAGSAFDLEGEVIHDADPDAGPLFRGEPPQLRCLAETPYELVVVGEEGPRDQSPQWRECASDYEELRPAIAARGSGWFFVRLYDQDDRLIESLDFRFSRKLQSIKVHAGSPIPGPDGHFPAFLDILHDDTVEVTPVGDTAQGLSVGRMDAGSCIEIPPSPYFDHTKWLIMERDERETGGVSLCVSVDRVWWLLRDEQAEFSGGDWTDRPLTLKEKDLCATSRQVLRVRLPAAWRANEVRIGVEIQRSLTPRPMSGHPNELELACRELGRFAEANQGALSLDLKLWLRPGETQDWAEALLARFSIPPTDIDAIDSPPLHLQVLEPVRLMQVLTRVRRRHRRYKKIIDELRWTYYRPLRRRPRRKEGSREKREAFLREALCLLALVIEESYAAGEKTRVPSRWARRAKLARRHFPENFTAIKSRVPPVASAIRRIREPR